MNKLSKVKVTALHGFKENTIAVDFLPNKPMSFVYGFNGIGKTTVFKLVNAALNPNKKNSQILDSVKFGQIEIEFANKDVLTIKNPNKRKSEWEDTTPNDFISSYDYSWKSNNETIKAVLENGEFIIRATTNNKENNKENVNKLIEKLDSINIDLLLCEDYYKTKLPEFKFKKHEKVLENKYKIFEDVISNPGLTDKYIHINRETGELEITAKFENKQYTGLTTDNLSQGEKNLLLLYYHLIFKVPEKIPDDYVYIQLIDNPETFMHVDFLITFYDNLCYINDELGRNKNYQFIITTHSPAITYDHNELMRGMRRKNNGKTE